MAHPLATSLVRFQVLREGLQQQFGDIDEETLRDTLEGATDLTDVIAGLIRSRREDIALVAALRGQIEDMRARLGRLQARADTKRDLVASAMAEADLKTLTEPDFTLSLRPIPAPLVVVDDDRIPEEFWKPQPPKLDRQGLIAALRTGRGVPGATLGNSAMTIAVRTR